MRYINPRFTYLFTYLPGAVNCDVFIVLWGMLIIVTEKYDRLIDYLEENDHALQESLKVEDAVETLGVFDVHEE